MPHTRQLNKAKIKENMQALMETVHRNTDGFHHSTPVIVVESTKDHGRLEVGLREFMLTAAIGGLNVLMSGRSGSGKTTFARSFVKSIFGSDFGFLQIDAKLSESKFRDIAFSKIKEGKKLSDAVAPTNFLTAPAVILDEYNRTPEVLVNLLQGYLVNGVVTLEGGAEIRPGVQINGERYQWKIGTVNQGMDYTGTSNIDKASLDRFATLLPLDVFPPAERDCDKIGINSFAEPEVTEKDNISRYLFELKLDLPHVPISPAVNKFKSYLLKKDQCYKSPDGTKLSIANFTAEFCESCHASVSTNVCGSIFAPSERAVNDALRFSQAFAMLRSYKTGSEPAVEMEDFKAVLPFVTFRKMKILDGWVGKYSFGSEWYATNLAINEMYSRWSKGVERLQQVLIKKAKGAEVGKNDRDLELREAQRDPACVSIEVVKTLFNKRNEIDNDSGKE